MQVAYGIKSSDEPLAICSFRWPISFLPHITLSESKWILHLLPGIRSVLAAESSTCQPTILMLLPHGTYQLPGLMEADPGE